MPGFDDIRNMANSSIPIGACASMPVPIMCDGRVIDAIFLFSVNRMTRKPRRPVILLEVDFEGGVVDKLDSPIIFRDVAFIESDLKSPKNYRALADEAKECYSDARSEFSRGVAGDAAARYARLVRSITQDSLMPFYEALAPSVFELAKS